MDILIILFLILLNGVFAMSEIAIVSARRARLQTLASRGNHAAATALDLNERPSRFLSTIQVGITAIGVLNGAVGESALAEPLAAWFATFPAITHYSEPLALGIVVIVLTYLSVVIGELVPKRLALLGPERIAIIVARPMVWLARLTHPLVHLFSLSSDALLRLLRARPTSEPPVSNEEIKVLMEQGAEAGVFHASESAIVSNVLRLDEQNLRALMTPRMDIYHIDLDDPLEENLDKLANSPYSRVVVCRGGLDHILGLLELSDLLHRTLSGKPMDLAAELRTPLYIPDTITATHLLESFKKSKSHIALLVDEYGDLQGLVTLTDVMTAIVGDIPMQDETPEEAEAVQREDGSWLIDGMMPVTRFKEMFGLDILPKEDTAGYNTIGGFVMVHLDRIPAVADHFEWGGLRFEVVDMDKHRVDRVLVARIEPSQD